MLLRAVSGKSIPFTHHELLRLLKQPWFHVFILAAAFGAASVYPFNRPPEHRPIMVVVFWIVMSYVFIILFTLALTMATTILDRLKWRWMFEAPFTLITVTLTTFIGSQVSYWMSVYVHMSATERVINVAINFLAVELFILLYVHVLRDHFYTPAMEASSVDNVQTLNSHVFIGDGKSVPYGDITVVEAQGHYVRVQTDESSTMTRGRFTNVVAQLPAQSGIQIHRSIWIAVRIVRDVRKHRGAMTIILTDEDELKVARPRQKEVAASLRAHGHIF